jgi:pyruvate/oxaloacetate carboxyltransferase
MRVNKIDIFDTFDPEIDLFNFQSHYCNQNVNLTEVPCLSCVTVSVGHTEEKYLDITNLLLTLYAVA